MKLRFALVAALLLLTSACADLAAVQDYAKASASVPGYDEATKEFGSRFTRAEVYLDEKGRRTAQILTPERQRAVPDLIAVHKNLQAYMLVLGKLAGAQTFNLDKQTEGLQKAIVAFPRSGWTPTPPTPLERSEGSSPSGRSSASSNSTSSNSSPRQIRRSRL